MMQLNVTLEPNRHLGETGRHDRDLINGAIPLRSKLTHPSCDTRRACAGYKVWDQGANRCVEPPFHSVDASINICQS
jgi:hypothetical protein